MHETTAPRPTAYRPAIVSAIIPCLDEEGAIAGVVSAVFAQDVSEVIVVDGGGDLTNSLMGELMLAHAIKRGLAGFVINGAIRDAEAFLVRNLPVFAVGVTHRGRYKDGPGEIGYPISIDGMSIEPGDLILGDWDGVLAVPLEAGAIVRPGDR